MEPSAKGSVVVGVVSSLRSLKRAGRVSEEMLAARLGANALRLLGEKIEGGRWYPMATFGELVDYEWDVTGSDPAYAREAGARSADRMFDAGLYQQLDYAGRVARPKSREELVRQAKLITTVTGALYSFMTTAVRISQAGDQLEIVYENAGEFREPLRFSTEGYMNRVNERQGSSRRWTSERTRPDEIVFRMPLPGRLTAS
jgi:hypothetical protein